MITSGWVKDELKRRDNINKTKLMLEAGYTASAIAKQLGVGESTVRLWKQQIEQEETNK